jgi:hypothetical protein
MILAVETMKVTSRTGYRQTGGAWMEMIEWLLLHRIDGQCTWAAIDFADEDAADIAPTAASARLAIGDAAVMRA